MNALESRPITRPTPGQLVPFHPETHHSFQDFKVGELPSDEDRTVNTRWVPTGFTLASVDDEMVGNVLKDRFFHNPSVGYTFRLEDATVVEYQYQADPIPGILIAQEAGRVARR